MNNNPVDIKTAKDIGCLLRSKRKELGINQAVAAGMCNTGVRFFSELENGKPTLEIDKVLHVLRSFGFTINVDDRTKS
ncbi:helix-turn-helix transcriptional regulator [Candidatus Margulisiibacteriota bacterium]